MDNDDWREIKEAVNYGVRGIGAGVGVWQGATVGVSAVAPAMVACAAVPVVGWLLGAAVLLGGTAVGAVTGGVIGAAAPGVILPHPKAD